MATLRYLWSSGSKRRDSPSLFFFFSPAFFTWYMQGAKISQKFLLIYHTWPLKYRCVFVTPWQSEGEFSRSSHEPNSDYRTSRCHFRCRVCAKVQACWMLPRHRRSTSISVSNVFILAPKRRISFWLGFSCSRRLKLKQESEIFSPSIIALASFMIPHLWVFFFFFNSDMSQKRKVVPAVRFSALKGNFCGKLYIFFSLFKLLKHICAVERRPWNEYLGAQCNIFTKLILRPVAVKKVSTYLRNLLHQVKTVLSIF